ncbi:lipopolysaccharide biosynthesis protein [Alloalcanivorax xenomutans]|uniref:lipopolysaccharide biosynthesis protein n=1 Tax=Alloalcanivorax xenomutans TaxID=1094342 RepID=UPI003BA9C22A
MSRVRRLSAGLQGRLRGEMGQALIRTFIARAIAALGALALALVIGRLYGPAGVGVYALAQGLLLGAGLLSRTGMDNALMRYVGQDHSSPFVLRYLRWAVTRCFIISLVAAAILWVGRPWFEALFDATGLAGVLTGIALAVPAYAFGFLLSGFFKGIRKPATACLLENGSVALVAGVLILVWEKTGNSAGLTIIGYAYAVAAWLVALQGGYQVWRWCRRQPWWSRRAEQATSSEGAPVSLAQFTATSRAFFMTNLASFMQQVLGVMVAGWLLSSTDLGLFKSSQQTATLIGFILIVINAIFPPRFASLYHQGQIAALGRLARQGALLGAVVAAPLLLLCLVFPGWVLSWFGDGFQNGAPLLRMIALAQLVNVSTGSVGFLLNMTGHERLMRNIALICNALGLLAFFVLIPPFGALGAALALAFVLVVQNLVALLFVWRRLGIWTLPGPNLLALIGIKSSVVR